MSFVIRTLDLEQWEEVARRAPIYHWQLTNPDPIAPKALLRYL